MAASRLRLGDSRCVIVGADRIAANGDVANKIGTYALALAASAHHGVPFYVARADAHLRSRHARRRRHPDRAARRRTRSPASRRPHGAGRRARLESRVRRHAGRADHGHHHRPRRACRPVRPPAAHRLMPSILALDQGTTGSTALVIAPGRPGAGPGIPRVHPVLPRARLGRARPGGDLPRHARGRARGARRGGRAPRRHRHHQPARDRGALGPRDAGARRAGPSCGRTGAPPTAAPSCARAARSDCSGERTGLVLDPYFSATKLEWLLARARTRRRAERGELAFGHDRQLAGRAAHRRRGSTSTDHTNASPHDAVRPRARATGTTSCSRCSVCRASSCPTSSPRAAWSASATPAHLRRALPIAGLAGDQQAALFGQGCVARGNGQEHLRHRRVPAGAPRRPACPLRPRPARHRGVRPAGGAGLRAGGQRVHRRAPRCSGCATGSVSSPRRRKPTRWRGACRTPAACQFVPAFVGLGTPHWEAEARGTITGLTRGTTRAHLVRAALESMACSSAELVEAMARRRGERRQRAGAPGGRRRRGQRLADAVPGRRARRPGRAARHGGDHRARRGRAGRAWRSASGAGRAIFCAGRRFTRFEPGTDAAERRRRRANGSARSRRRWRGRAVFSRRVMLVGAQ